MTALAAGILLCGFARFSARELVCVLAVFATLTALAALASTKRMTVACALVAVVFVGSAIAEKHRRGQPPQLNAESNETLILVGCVVEPSALSEDRDHFVLELARHARARVTVTLREGEIAPLLRYGQKVEVTAKIRIPHNFQNPGSFDYAGYLARQDIYWTASAHGATSFNIMPGECGTRFWALIYGLRTTALDRLESFYKGDSYTTGMMEATLIGETTKLQKVWTDHYRRTGTYHALVISGLHVSVLAGTLLFLMRICLIPRPHALAIAATAAWLYALISGWQAPVVRAAGGFTLFLIARLVYRRGRLLNLLAAVAIAFLLFDPDQLYDASFQLSFMSVAAIGALASPIIEKTTGPRSYALRALSDADRDLHQEPIVAQFRVEMRLVAETIALWTRLPLKGVMFTQSIFLRLAFYIYEMALISLVIQVGLALPMILYFHRVSFSGVSANLLIVPLLSAAVPVGFLAILTNWKIPAIGAQWLLNASQHIADWHMRWEPDWRIPDPPLWLSLAFVAALLWMAFTANARAWMRWSAAVSVLALFALLYSEPFVVHAATGRLELTSIDVGQGDSLLLQFPNGRNMLVDAGGFPVFGSKPNPRKPNLDIGEDVVSPYLWSRGIRHIDVLVSTHAHEDHIGGMAAIIENFHPRELWTGANPPDNPVWKAVKQKAEAFGVKILPLTEGGVWDWGGARIEVLAPAGDYVPLASPKNNDSLVLRLRYGAHTFLLTGDMEKQVEARLLEGSRIDKIDVLKVGHHGSRTSSSDGFIAAAHPTFAIISVGLNNSYHHPTVEVLERLAATHTGVFRTDRVGLISIESDGRQLRVHTNLWSQGEREGLQPVFGGLF
jgi:competence protein ComEC